MQWATCLACDGTGTIAVPETPAEVVDGPLSGLVRVGWTRADLEVVR